MTKTKTHFELIKAIDYLRFIPPELHQEAQDFIDFVTYVPFETPKYCAHCGSVHFHPTVKRKRAQYYCKNCKGVFSPVTGTPFSNFRSHNEWEPVAKHMLAGVPPARAITKLGMKGAIISREKVLESIMATDFFNLHQWWLLFRYQVGTPTKDVSLELMMQHKKFQEWLQNLLQPKIVVCPRCKSTKCSIRIERNNQAGYYCKSCKQSFSLLNPTHFRRAQLTAEFPRIFNYLLSGICDTEINSLRGLKASKTQALRSKLMAQLRDLELDLLADWIEWKRYCRFRQIKKEQAQNKLKSQKP